MSEGFLAVFVELSKSIGPVKDAVDNATKDGIEESEVGKDTNSHAGNESSSHQLRIIT